MTHFSKSNIFQSRYAVEIVRELLDDFDTTDDWFRYVVEEPDISTHIHAALWCERREFHCVQIFSAQAQSPTAKVRLQKDIVAQVFLVDTEITVLDAE
jgi:hypothetical protein